MTDVARCVCARKVTTLRAGRKVEKIIGRTLCMICRGIGMTTTCPACQGAGLMPGSTVNAPLQCGQCNGNGRVPWKT